MNKKDEIKIEVLSQIDDDIIEKQTKKRYALMTGKPKKSHRRTISVLSAAAAFVLVCGILLGVLWPMLFPGDGRQVPIYEGMTVSNQAPEVKLGADLERWPASLSLADIFYADVLASETVADGDNRLVDAPETVKDNRSLYYAKKGEDIYVSVHIDNPEDFEILSFTLNGFKYQSYMFETGSNSEELILKINVGEEEGLVAYTIDAIKYVDGTEIKDVRMDGDRTVCVAVYPEEQPTAGMASAKIGTTTFSFDLRMTDTHALIEDSEGEVLVSLYQGDERVQQKTVPVSETVAVDFEGLTPGVEYCCEVVANYDSMDGRGYGSYLLTRKTFRTKSHVTVKDLSLNENEMTFSLEIAESANVTVQKIELLCDGNVVAEGDANTRRFDELYWGDYILSITYSFYDGETEKIGYVYSSTVRVNYMGPLDRIVHGAVVTKAYSGGAQVWNETTQDYRRHRGIDLISSTGDTGVYAATNGYVWVADSGQVTIEATYGNETFTFFYRSLGEILVTEGTYVTAGQQIGTLGTTLHFERNEQPHLCLEMVRYINGMYTGDPTVDPQTYFK